MALLLVVNLLANLFGNWVAFLAINSLTLTTRNIPALLLWDLRALSFVDNITLLGRNILTNLFLDSLALFIILSGALFFMDSLRNSSGNADTFQLWNIVALLILKGPSCIEGDTVCERQTLVQVSVRSDTSVLEHRHKRCREHCDIASW